MVYRSYLDSTDAADKYMSYLTDAGLFYFTGILRNDAIRILTDMEGNDPIVCLTMDGSIEAETSLKFRDHQGRPRKTKLKIMK